MIIDKIRTYSPREAADVMGVSESSVKRWIDRGRLKAGKTAGGHRRITSEALGQFIRDQGMAEHARIANQPGPADALSASVLQVLEGLRPGRSLELQLLIQEELQRGDTLLTLIDRHIYPAYQVLQKSYTGTEQSRVLQMVTQGTREALAQLKGGGPLVTHIRPRLVCADLGDSGAGLPTYLAEVVCSDLVDSVQLGSDADLGELKRALADENIVLFWLSVSGAMDEDRCRNAAAMYRFARRAGIKVAVFGRGLPEELAPQIDSFSAFRGYVQGVLAGVKPGPLSLAIPAKFG